MEEGVVAAENVMGIGHEIEDHFIPLSIFTYPEIASIGLNEKEARQRSGKDRPFPFRSNPTAVISEETDGLIKVVVDKENDRILGVHIIGHDASTLISIASLLLEQGVKAKKFSRIIQAHPTTPEALKEAFLDVEGLALHLPSHYELRHRAKSIAMMRSTKFQINPNEQYSNTPHPFLSPQGRGWGEGCLVI